MIARVLRTATAATEAGPIRMVKVGLPEAAAAFHAAEHVWVDLTAPSRAEMQEVADVFGLPGLITEAALSLRPRPKLDAFERFNALAVYVPAPAAGGDQALRAATSVARGQVPLDSVHLVFGERFLVTAHGGPVPLLEQTAATLRGEEAAGGPIGALVYHLLDEAVDAYFPVLDRMAEQVEALQEFAFLGGARSSRELQSEVQQLYRVKRGLMSLHRIVAPQRDALQTLARSGVPFAGYPAPGLLQDVFDHAVRVEQASQLYHDLLINARESYLTRISNELAVVAKLFLAITCLLSIPALVTTAYGMRVGVIAELHVPMGHLWAFIVIAVLDGLMLLWFNRRGLM